MLKQTWELCQNKHQNFLPFFLQWAKYLYFTTVSRQNKGVVMKQCLKKVLLSFTPNQLVEVINHTSHGSKGKVDQAFTVICDCSKLLESKGKLLLLDPLCFKCSNRYFWLAASAWSFWDCSKQKVTVEDTLKIPLKTEFEASPYIWVFLEHSLNFHMEIKYEGKLWAYHFFSQWFWVPWFFWKNS